MQDDSTWSASIGDARQNESAERGKRILPKRKKTSQQA
jgi:hypothetical protein